MGNSKYKLELLEPRILLSADGISDTSALINSPNTDSVLQEQESSLPADLNSSVAYDPAEQVNSIFDDVSEEPDVSPADPSESTESGGQETGHEDSGNQEAQKSENNSQNGNEAGGNDPVLGADISDPFPNQLMETLNLANAPPESGTDGTLEFYTKLWEIHDLLLRVVGDDLQIVDQENSSTALVSRPLAEINKVIIKGMLSVDDTLTIDFTTPFSTDILFEGDSGDSDSLVLIGASAESIGHILSSKTDAPGRISIDFGASGSTIEHSNLVSVRDFLDASDRVFTWIGNISDEIQLVDATADGMSGLRSLLTKQQVDFKNSEASLSIDAGDGNDRFYISGLDGEFDGALQLMGGAGHDVFNFSTNTSVGVTITGGLGSDTLFGYDTANDWVITETDAGTFNGHRFEGIENLVGGADSDSFVFAGGSLNGLMAGGLGNDTVVGADTANTWILSGANSGTLHNRLFIGIENLVGGAGADTFVFAGGSLSGTIDGGLGSDFLIGANTPNTWIISGGDEGTLNALVFFDIESIIGGEEEDLFILSLVANVSGNIVGGLGLDGIRGADKENAWNITGTHAGTLNDLSFSGVEHLEGGTEQDDFMLSGGVDFAGSIDGAGGTNSIDYSLYSTGVVVDLGAGTATNTTGLDNIQNVHGGSGEDILVGNDDDNILSGGLGNDYLMVERE